MSLLSCSGWLCLDKPLGFTSRQALSYCHKSFKANKSGYLGTLDPLASGVLPIAFGEACKTIHWAEMTEKTYHFQIKWGIETATGDLEGDIIARNNHLPSLEEITGALSLFKGKINQVPPIYSAIKINGQRAYNLARQGKQSEVQMPTRHVEISDFSILNTDFQINLDDLTFSVSCSKGTYIRTLAQDFARHLGTVGTLRFLRRVKVGPFSIEDAICVDFLKKIQHNEELVKLLKPIDYALDDISGINLTKEEAARVRLGQKIPLTQLDSYEADLKPLQGLDGRRFIGKMGHELVALLYVKDNILRIAHNFNRNEPININCK